MQAKELTPEQIEKKALKEIEKICLKNNVKLIVQETPVNQTLQDGTIIIGKQYIIGIKYNG